MDRYQDALHVDGTESGERDCAPRWALIAPHLPATGIVLDIGSNLGYYGLQAVRSSPSVAVVSVEADPEIAERQGALLREHDTNRICLVQGAITADVAAAWSATCDWFDMTLMLSIIHWLDDPAAVVRDVAAMSGVLIAEVPDAQDEGACGRQHLVSWASPEHWFETVTGRSVTHLGRIERHTSSTPSHLIMVHGPVERVAHRPYWGADYQRSDAEPYRIAFDGHEVSLEVRGMLVDYKPGVNLVSLMRLGRLVHPAPDYWVEEAGQALAAEPGHGDPFPHNMIWTPDGIRLIDADDLHTEQAATAAERSVERNVAAWAANRTASDFGYVRERPGLWRRTRRVVGRLLRPLIGDRRVERLKAALGLPPTR